MTDKEHGQDLRVERIKSEDMRVSASNWLQILAQRLEKLGMPMEGERLARMARLSLLYSRTPHELHDLLLMGIAVESEHREGADVPGWV